MTHNPIRWSRCLVGVALTGLLAACHTPLPTPPQLRDSGPGHWDAVPSARALPPEVFAERGQSVAQGFAVFADPVLEGLLAQALDRNPDLRQALLRVAQSRVMRGMAAQASDPVLMAEGSAGRTRQSESGSATRLISAIAPASQSASLIDFIASPFSLLQGGFEASWEPDLWGRVHHSEAMAQAQLENAQAMQAQVQLVLLSEVTRQYVQWRGLQQQQALLEQDIQREQTRTAVLAARYAGGLVSSLESEQQHLREAGLQARLPALLAQQTQALNALSALLGVMPGQIDALLPTAAVPPAVTLPDLSLGMPTSVVAARPDVLASEARLREAIASVGVAQADLYPRIILGASVGGESLSTRALTEWGSRQWSLGPRFSIPLFDQGRRQRTVELRTLAQQEAAIAYQQTVLAAWQEVDTAIARYNAERAQRAVLTDKVAAARRTQSVLEQQFSAGLISWLPLADAEQAVAAAEAESADGETRQALALVAVLTALGKTLPVPVGDDR